MGFWEVRESCLSQMKPLFIISLIKLSCHLLTFPPLFFCLDFYWCWFGVQEWLSETSLEIPKPSCTDPCCIMELYAQCSGSVMEHGRCVHVYVCVCLCACLVERFTNFKIKKNKKKQQKKKTGHPTFEWDVVFAEVPKKTKKEAIFFCCERDAA